MPLPRFTDKGLLPEGDHPMTIAELRESFLVTGAGLRSKNWDAAWRRQLVDNLETVLRALQGCQFGRVFIAGSFVERKDYPGDIDGYYECSLEYLISGALERDLGACGEDLPEHGKKSAFRRKYYVDLLPNAPGGPGFLHRSGKRITVAKSFRHSRAWQPKGIIEIVRGETS